MVNGLKFLGFSGWGQREGVGGPKLAYGYSWKDRGDDGTLKWRMLRKGGSRFDLKPDLKF